MKSIRIGSGAGYAGDRLEPALELIEKGRLDYIGFECLAERTIAIAQQEKQRDPSKGYNELLEYRMEKVIPLAWEHGVKVITNMGAANPVSAAEVCARIAGKNGITGIKIAAVTGDDVYDRLGQYQKAYLWDIGKELCELEGEIVSANAYMGVEGIVEALKGGADIVITGRVADPALFMAPLIHEFGWHMDDWDLLGKGTQLGHLLECAGQLCGGYYADPGKKDVPDLHRLGFPIAEAREDGAFIVTKVEGTGGIINRHTCTEQMLYEIHDPARYLTPDVVADFSRVTFTEESPDRVITEGATGHQKTGKLKVSLGYKDCFIGEGEISYGGPNCLKRAKLAADVILNRIEMRKIPVDELKIDIIGVNSLYWSGGDEPVPPAEVRLRVAARTKDRISAARIGEEVEALYTNGPSGGCGATKRLNEVLSVASFLIDQSDVKPTVVYMTGR